MYTAASACCSCGRTSTAVLFGTAACEMHAAGVREPRLLRERLCVADIALRIFTPLLDRGRVLPASEHMQPCRVRASAQRVTVTRLSACLDRASTTVARQRVGTASWVRTRGYWVGTESTARGSFDDLPVGVFGQRVWGATSKLAQFRPRIWSWVPNRHTLCVVPARDAGYGRREAIRANM